MPAGVAVVVEVLLAAAAIAADAAAAVAANAAAAAAVQNRQQTPTNYHPHPSPPPPLSAPPPPTRVRQCDTTDVFKRLEGNKTVLHLLCSLNRADELAGVLRGVLPTDAALALAQVQRVRALPVGLHALSSCCTPHA